MKKNIYTFVSSTFLSIALLTFLSSFTGVGEEENSATKPRKESTIMVIPFQPTMYFNNGDHFICQASNVTPGELNKMIRSGITNSMSGELTSLYSSLETTQESIDKQVAADYTKLYSMTRYSMEKKPIVAYYKNDRKDEDELTALLNLTKKNNAPEYLNPQKNNLKSHNYFRATFINDSFISNYSKTNNVSHYVFIDHFEMETHYKDCHDLQKNVSKRDLFVHYTLLSAQNKFIDGGVVCYTYQSSSNNAKELIKETMPVISNMIMHEIKTKIQ